MMVVSFNSSTTDATSGTGIAYLSRDLRTHCFHWVRVAQYLIQKQTNNTMTEQKQTNNTMTEQKQTNNTMTEQKQTHNGR
jgi:phage antirepressor YoqD-like protein